MKKTISLTLALLLIFNLFSQTSMVGEETSNKADLNDYFYNVLELAPELKDFVLKENDFKDNAKLYQFTIKEYNAIREDMIGKYDIIYISNGKTDDEKYTTLGEPVQYLPAGAVGKVENGTIITHYDNKKGMYEYWPGTDFTQLTLAYLQKFMDAGHLVFADKNLKTFESSKAIINKFIQDNKAEIIFEDDQDASDDIKAYTQGTKYSGSLRPYLDITSLPTQYNGTEASMIDTSYGTTIKFDFSALSFVEETSFDIKLYFDINGDNKFKADDYELLKVRSNISSNENLSISMDIPEDFNGLQQWKLEIIDLKSNTNTYKTGFMAFRGDKPLHVNVLQIACNGNTFNLGTELIDKDGNNLLTSFSDDYIIDVDVITMSEFKALYSNDANFKLTEYIKPGNSKTYNMLVFGFADIYGNADITEENIANDIKDFINTGQSVMFTHDNLTFRVDQTGGWSRGFTKYFRNYVGQNIYAEGNMPDSTYTTLGYSEMALERAINDKFTTTRTVYASNDGILANYPFRILGTNDIKDFYDYSVNERKLDVALTHYQYYQLDLNDEDVVVWYSLIGNNSIDEHDPGNYYYTYSKGNITYSGTGHSNLADAKSYEERKLFVNTIIKAIRGANFAPEVLIQGVTNGDNVGKNRSSMEFSILATDPDINDEYLDGKVYLDMNGDSIYTEDEIVNTYSRSDYSDGPHRAIENRIPKDVKLDLTKLDNGLTEFGFKVIVSDKLGASSTKYFRFPLVDTPEMSVVINGPSGILVGDKETITAKVKLTIPADSLETKVKNISLTSSIYKSDDKDTELDMFSGSDYIVSNYGDYSKAGTHLAATHSDIVSLTNGSEQSIGDYSYDIYGKTQGDYYLKSDISYGLEYYGFTEAKSSPKDFAIRKGKITYELIDDLGAKALAAFEARLVYFPVDKVFADEASPDLTGGSAVSGLNSISIINGSVTLGDDAVEILKTGKYALEVKNTAGEIVGISKVSKLNIDNFTDNVTVVVDNPPISNTKWTHEKQSFNALGYALLADSNSSNSIIEFNTGKVFEAFELGLNVSDASSKMNYALIKIEFDDGLGTVINVKDDFDVTSNKIQLKTAKTMAAGNYKAYFSHEFKSFVKGGSSASYRSVGTVNVTLKDASGTSVDKVYSFPTDILKFIKAIDLL